MIDLNKPTGKVPNKKDKKYVIEHYSYGKLTHREDIHGNKYWYRYNKRGNLVSVSTLNKSGYTTHTKYDTDGKLTYFRNSDGFICRWNYDNGESKMTCTYSS